MICFILFDGYVCVHKLILPIEKELQNILSCLFSDRELSLVCTLLEILNSYVIVRKNKSKREKISNLQNLTTNFSFIKNKKK